MNTLQYISHEKMPDDFHYIITTHVMPSWISRIFGGQPFTIKHYGSGTVWYRYIDGEVKFRASIDREGELSAMYTNIRLKELL
jgi:hypothetical protein